MQHIKTGLLVSSLMLFLAPPTFADNMGGMSPDEMQKEHGGEISHMFRLETDIGTTAREGADQRWDFQGWVGGDENKLWLQSEGERLGGTMDSAEFWALYSRNVATFWDAQVGLRQDTSPHPATYLTMGVTGLAPYYFETQAHLFISNHGNASFRLREENDLLITQRLITQPYAEINLSARNEPEQQLGAGLANASFGLQTRYEITRKFAPYVDLRYERKFGSTISIVKQDGETGDDFIASVGLRIMF
ncbi:MAG: copper resistance protein B [Pseudomonadota bacterium]|nr:copper resistance protein B [Pseudomonadota bacterium]MDE3038340.1 copper resistance protein B [Pseudomonadota bacterium]